MDLTELHEYFNPHLYEMSNFHHTTTGLPPGVKLWIREEPHGLPHTKYRIKLGHPQYGSAVFAIWGDEPKQVAGDWIITGSLLNKIQTMIKMTHNELRSHIDGQIDSAVLTDAFRQISNQISKV